MIQTKKRTHSWATRILSVALLCGTAAAAPLLAQNSQKEDNAVPAELVQKVREATRQFLDVNEAVETGYGPAFGCVTGPDHGAMGIH